MDAVISLLSQNDNSFHEHCSIAYIRNYYYNNNGIRCNLKRGGTIFTCLLQIMPWLVIIAFVSQNALSFQFTGNTPAVCVHLHRKVNYCQFNFWRYEVLGGNGCTPAPSLNSHVQQTLKQTNRFYAYSIRTHLDDKGSISKCFNVSCHK